LKEMSQRSAPPSSVEISGDGNLTVQIQGDDNTVVLGQLQLTLTRYLNRRQQDQAMTSLGDAAGILSPYALSIPLVGQSAALQDLLLWLRSDLSVSIRVLTARGGGGKTRIGLELCDLAVQEGWDAGFVKRLSLREEALKDWSWKRPTLLVIDRAASWAPRLRDWFIDLADHPGKPRAPLRVLLLERHADPESGWWSDAFGRGGEDTLAVRRLLDPADRAYRLPALMSVEDRRAVLEVTLERVGCSVPLPESGSDFDRRLAELVWGGEPLFLMMAGLTAAQTGLGEVLALSRTDLTFLKAKDELERLREISRSHDIKPDFFVHMAAFVSLSQGMSRSQAEEAIVHEKEVLRYHGAGDPPEIYKALQVALPGLGNDLAPIFPDVIGEAAILEALGDRDPDKALASVLRAATLSPAVPNTIVRTAQDFGEMRAEPITWLRAVGRVSGPKQLADILNEIPRETLVLREVAVELTTRFVEIVRREGRSENLTIALVVLAARLGSLGRDDEALVTIDEAVASCRALVAQDRERFLPLLAGTLNNLSIVLARSKRMDESIQASSEVIELYRELIASGKNELKIDLAGSLSNLSNHLSDAGDLERALATAEEVVNLLQELELPGGPPPGLLLAALNTLSNRLSSLGHRERSLQVGRELVRLCQELASRQRDAFLPDLASALANLAGSLGRMDFLEEARQSAEEAVVLYRDLTKRYPWFAEDLARALDVLANRLIDVGCSNQSIHAQAEAIGIYRGLAAQKPDLFRPHLARTLSNRGGLFGRLGRADDALEPTRESLELYSALAQEHPRAFGADLTTALHNLGAVQATLGNWEEAEELNEEVVARYRAHPSKGTEADLAMSLRNLGICREKLEKVESALEAFHEALQLLVPYYREVPRALRKEIKTTLRRYLALCERLGRDPDRPLLQEIQDIERKETRGDG
jgi:tetratricopeptide (TPR) repeat protein